MQKFDFIELIDSFNRLGIRYLLIGGQAAIQYGAPIFTFDIDLWIHPDDRNKVMEYLQKEGFEIDSESPKKQPIIKVYCGEERIDLFFAKKFVNRKGRKISFDNCFATAVIKYEPKGEFYIRLCPIKELIELKNMREPDIKDKEQIKYLKEVINEERKG